MEESKLLVFQTDFGYKDSTVAAMYGVVKSVDRRLEIIDSTHELPPFDIWSASYRLWQAMEFWPEGTVFVSVVDPGVGTDRRACVALTGSGHYVVTPDNGTLTHVAAHHGIREVREIDETVNYLHGRRTDDTAVFHGRDLFGYCAAKLAAGIISFAEVGPAYDPKDIITMPVPEPAYEQGRAQGAIVIDDPNFGNLFTNLKTEELLRRGFRYGKTLRVTVVHGADVVFDQMVPFSRTFGAVAPGEAVAYNNELMDLSLAVSCGSFRDKFGIGFGSGWTVTLEAEI